jgi:NADH-quinone oxidoreductase subunit L
MAPWLLLLIPALPAFSAALLSVFGGRLPYNVLGGIATLFAAGSLVVTLCFCGAGVFGAGTPVDFASGPWIATQAFQAGLHLRLDSTALCMCLLVTFFGTVITLYSVGYMRHDREQARFFASLNLFVASMLTLVLADNLVLIFLGWEGVGLCSYLLIGHYWEQPDVPLAAFRAFFVNRIGDVLFLLGVFTVFSMFGTVSLSELSQHGPDLAAIHPQRATIAALLLLGGAFAKSAQAPLHVWLADAMAGPTPVSALIHAATMVTAGIYLVMRLDWLYAVSPEARLVIAVCSLVTLVLGAFLALSQTDIKKILAYSTLSNLALMFLALSAGASGAAMLHLFGHAFFKALLFLSAGSVIIAAHHEQDVRRLGGVLKKLPITNAAFLIGCIGGAGLLPYLAAGFFTKEAVLGALEEAQYTGWGISISGKLIYWIVVAVESLSALYLFRLYGYLRGDSAATAEAHDSNGDHGDHSHGPIKEPGPAIVGVLILLAVAAPIFGILSAPASFGIHSPLYGALMGGAEAHHGPELAHVLPFLILNLALAGGCFFVFSRSDTREKVLGSLKRLQLGTRGPLSRKFYFDDVYAVIVVLPLRAASFIARLILESIFTGALTLIGWLGRVFSLILRRFQTGKANQYAMAVLLFTILLVFFLAGR